MKYCDLTLSTAAENLACDEALLQLAEEDGAAGGSFGFGSRCSILWWWLRESSRDRSQSSVLPSQHDPGAASVHGRRHRIAGTGLPQLFAGSSHIRFGPAAKHPRDERFHLKRHQAALSELLQAPIELQGHTDLAIGGLKVSGNSQRRKRYFLLFHGTFLLHLDISLVEKALLMPSKEPGYRLNRSHFDFLLNIKMPSSRVRQALVKCWDAKEPVSGIPFEKLASWLGINMRGMIGI